MENYLSVLEESLKKKINILDELTLYTKAQQEILKAEEMNFEEFDVLVEKKDVLVQKLMELDNGFETTYERIAQELVSQKERYAVQIGRLQELIECLTDKNVKLQAMEQRNKERLVQYFGNTRQKICRGRQNSQMAMNYYKNMSNGGFAPPQFMDSKQ